MHLLITDHGPKVSKSSASLTAHWIAVVNGCLDCLLCSPVKKLKPLENKLRHARRHSYHVEQVQR